MLVYPVRWLDFTIPDRFHHTPFLIAHILDPIGLSSGHEHMRSESIYVSVQFLVLVDFEAFRVLDLACLAIVVAVFAIDGRVHFGEDEGRYFRDRVGGGAGSEEGFPSLKDGRERHLLGCGHGRSGVTVDGGRARHVGR